MLLFFIQAQSSRGDRSENHRYHWLMYSLTSDLDALHAEAHLPLKWNHWMLQAVSLTSGLGAFSSTIFFLFVSK